MDRSGGRSPLLHAGSPLQSNMPLSVIPQQFYCVLRVSLPCGWTQSTLPYWVPVAIQHAPFRHTAPTCPFPSYRSGFAASCVCRYLAGSQTKTCCIQRCPNRDTARRRHPQILAKLLRYDG